MSFFIGNPSLYNEVLFVTKYVVQRIRKFNQPILVENFQVEKRDILVRLEKLVYAGSTGWDGVSRFG